MAWHRERFFVRHGGKVVVLPRFVEGVRQANGIIVGITRMPRRRFLAFNTLGAALWVGVRAGLGDLAGIHITAVYEQIHRYQLSVVLAMGLMPAVLTVRHALRHRRREEDPRG
ncbi:DedA family protein [Amycolatopsis nalaikhensis]|uniref:DedA family protein n=1 Tax=Amycolatopsis nalaikhensis TaxID=715472 RepID=A0ABY8XU76_9PSEU|nr:hypothetical protein [Amycolatopsis sp. 2-2]WIV59254.1 hypothetical protein QP939_11805 [Amycolatopsis sp. 2-2]